MDYTKIKKILIVIFILLNVVLLLLNVFDNNNNYVSKKVINETENLFKEQDIRIATDIPRLKKELEQMEIGDVIIDKKFKDVDEHRIVEEIKSFSEGKLDKKRFIEFYETDDEIIFVEQIKGNLIYPNKITYNKEQKYADLIIHEIEMQELTKRTVLPAHVILINSYLESDIETVEKIELIYHEYEKNIAGPAWWIETDKGIKVFYAYKAYNGTEIILD